MTRTATKDTLLHTLIEQEITRLHFPNSAVAHTMHRKIQRADHKGEISMINRIFFDSIKPSRITKPISIECLTLLDKANCYAWLAYSLYDTCVDTGTIDTLPFANEFARTAHSLYIQAGVPIPLVSHFFQTVDHAIAHELFFRNNSINKAQPSSKHISQHSQLLADKSIAHCLGQFWIASLQDDVNTETILNGLRNYCAARQLSDDTYDWRDDYQHSHPTFATTTLIKIARKQYPQSSPLSIDIMNQAFWDHGLEELCTTTLRLADKSERQLEVLVSPQAKYISYIRVLKMAAQKSIQTHRKMKKQV